MITTHQALLLDFNAMRLAAAREAVQSLGLLTLPAVDVIFHLLDDRFVDHPRAICTAYRKDGEQLSNDEKRALGLRSNAFMSRKAFGDLTEKGRKVPLKAHDTVLLRATFTLSRYKTIKTVRADSIPELRDEFKYDVLSMECPVCKRLDGTIVKGDDVFVFPPDQCVCDTANYSVTPYIDCLANID